MMKKAFSGLLDTASINVISSVSGWQQAIELVCAPLLDIGAINSEYKAAIIQSTLELGPYYVLAPRIAMPHARPEQGVLNNALSLLIVQDGVCFHSEGNDPVYLLLLLAARDSDQHIQIITSISEFFCNDEDVNAAIIAQNPNDIIEILQKY